MVLTAQSLTTVYDLHLIDVSDIVDSAPDREHGGELETSLVMHLAPDRVRTDEIADHAPEAGALRRYTRGRVPTPPTDSRGVIGYPSRATAEKGAAVFHRWVTTLEGALRAGSDGRTVDAPAV